MHAISPEHEPSSLIALCTAMQCTSHPLHRIRASRHGSQVLATLQSAVAVYVRTQGDRDEGL